MEFDLVSDSIFACLGRVAEKADGESNAMWTKTIKDEMRRLGKEFGYSTMANGLDAASRTEWLYDLVWYNEKRDGAIEDIFLVMESEWTISFNDIRYDFEKLILARSPIRLMIFQAKDDEMVVDIAKQLYIIAFKCKISQRGDKYLLAGYNTETSDLFGYKFEIGGTLREAWNK
jgi:hypothetical protein